MLQELLYNGLKRIWPNYILFWFLLAIIIDKKIYFILDNQENLLHGLLYNGLEFDPIEKYTI